MSRSTSGTIFAILAFLMWGMLPIFWKQFDRIEAVTVISHRVLWSVASLLVIVLFRHNIFRAFKELVRPTSFLKSMALAFFLATNWIIYVWANNNDRIIELALGYYILPIVYIFVGFLFFKEKLSVVQWIAIILASVGVGLQAQDLTTTPWAAIGVAISFAIYGTIKKNSKREPMESLLSETLLICPFACFYLLWSASAGAPSTELTPLGDDFFKINLLISLTGIATLAPLLLFTEATRRVQFGTIGILQFIAPTGQFLTGWLMYKETLNHQQLYSFLFIWGAMALYLVAVFHQRRKAKKARRLEKEQGAKEPPTESSPQSSDSPAMLSSDQPEIENQLQG